MKLKLFTVLAFALTFNHLQAFTTTALPSFAATSAKTATATATTTATAYFVPAFAEATAGKGGDPTDLKVVVSQKRIWLVADETPMKCLKTQVKNAQGKVVLEKCFTSKTADWYLNIEALPKGEYTLHLGSERVEKFKK
ncbi:MAG: DUF3244 domain-containing protein [Saprospiraceae bacterium]